MHQRRILLEHAHNLRDLGGFPTEGGLVTKWNLLYRSDSLSELTKAEWQVLNGLNINCILDLRSDQEVKDAPICPTYPVESHHLSLMKELDEVPMVHMEDLAKMDKDDELTKQILKSMELDYTRTLFGNLTCAASILTTILNKLKKGDGSVLFLCSAGKDRTGITAAMLLYLCGVPREDIIADYMVSYTYNEKGINRMLSEIPKEVKDLFDSDSARQGMSSDPETMAGLLDVFEEKDLRKCLAENGFDAKKQQELADLITES